MPKIADLQAHNALQRDMLWAIDRQLSQMVCLLWRVQNRDYRVNVAKMYLVQSSLFAVKEYGPNVEYKIQFNTFQLYRLLALCRFLQEGLEHI